MITVGTLNQPVTFPELSGSKDELLGGQQLKQIFSPTPAQGPQTHMEDGEPDQGGSSAR